ncbi:putative component of anaerobic dehydrogenase [Desulfitobacterium dichloroeliminans LMG P-21439]|uniref:Putative component of anaerobic dehydrogenase n=1 Tax=Desulfitobacterium dichloroeliminans (strain LMG P-21439 / DCA1) TaxID=871963 RepID=L0F6W1_DESDL|nr:molecular chaperone TorD family protein [Desulfitobacterium dichloroeliminans]AGA68396.1 putative component of anaerobic dehydrogenase [Desulfitobacterium dichloroeliminans LMG P-21439]
MLNIDEIVTYTKARLQLYQLFSVLFNQQPSIELTQDFYKVFNPDTSLLLESSPAFNEGMQCLYTFSREVEAQEISEVTTSLNVEWLRLFRGIKPDYGLPPARASAYITYDIHALREHYASAGLKISHPQFEPDYAGVQLAFLYKLVSQELQHWIVNNQQKALKTLSQENDFTNEHLSWISELCHRGVEQAETSFYRGVLLLLSEFLESEQLWLVECSNTLYSLGSPGE